MPSKTLGIMLFTTPYLFENTSTAMKIAEAAIAKGYKVRLFTYGDGVHNFTVGQKPKAVPNPEQGFSELMAKGLSVELCGTCLIFRGIKREHIMRDAEPSSLEGLCKMMESSDIFITLSF